jgi:hypothetical protein
MPMYVVKQIIKIKYPGSLHYRQWMVTLALAKKTVNCQGSPYVMGRPHLEIGDAWIQHAIRLVRDKKYRHKVQRTIVSGKLYEGKICFYLIRHQGYFRASRICITAQNSLNS